MSLNTILVVFGTRPEAIKMAPVVRALERIEGFRVVTCVTGQHRELLDQVLVTFSIRPDFDLDIMSKHQDLFDVTSSSLLGLREVIQRITPIAVLVHGDTTTTLAASIAAFYERVPVGHVEAGLRTGDLSSPFPEEFNRVTTDRVSRWHFAPTQEASENLIAEGISEERIWVTGNTVADAIKQVLIEIQTSIELRNEIEKSLSEKLISSWLSSRIVLITMHRRENFGEGIKSVRRAIIRLAATHKDILFIFPVHPNPHVRDEMAHAFGDLENVLLTEPLEYQEFVWLLSNSFLVLTDSGGLQEEAPILGKPVLLMRDTTERPEGVLAGCVELVGTDEELIVNSVNSLLEDSVRYLRMSKGLDLYGDGHAAERIASALVSDLGM